jgi:scyllo-inositol 2-dehydrogenase (NADP+)
LSYYIRAVDYFDVNPSYILYNVLYKIYEGVILMNREVKVGLIGYGLGGRVFHAPIIESVVGLNLYKVYETRPENVQHLKERYPHVIVVSKVDEILTDPDITLIVIATPNKVHYELAKSALENGKDVVVEKPFTVTTEEADKLIALSKATNRILSVHHNRRWDSDFKTVEKVVKNNLVGDIVELEIHYDRFRTGFTNNWREENEAGSGMLYDLGSHLIDQAQCLLGLPSEVFANLEIQREGAKAIDYFEVILKYPKVTVTLKSGMLIREPGPHYVIHGTKGSFIKYGMDTQEDALKGGLIPKNIKEWGIEPEELWGKINAEVNGVHIIGKVESETGNYRDFYKNVYKAVLREESLAVTPEQARNTIRIIELAQQSNLLRQWVKFN